MNQPKLSPLFKAVKNGEVAKLRILLAAGEPVDAQDAERKQSIEEAEATFRTLAELYPRLGYELVPLPLASVGERVRFVRNAIGRSVGEIR